MPKLILTLLLFMAAFSLTAQTIICKDTTYQKKDTVIQWEKDTTWVKKQILVGYDTVREIKCNKWCQIGVTQPRIVDVSITPKYRIDSTAKIDSTALTIININTIKDTICTVMQSQYKMFVGVKFQQANIREQVQQAKDLTTDAARPNSVAVTGNNPLDDGNAAEWKADGFKTWVNVAWYENPNAKPYNFLQPADRQKWASGFETLCQKLKGNADGVAIENEPANGVYFQFPTGWLENYIEQLKIAIPIARKYGIKISDGSIPIEDVELIMNGTVKKDRTKRVKALMDAYKNLDLDYVLFHAHYKSTDGKNPVKDLTKTINYLASYTGHKVFSNELSMEGATGAVITWFLQGSYDAKCDYTVFWSGDGGSGNSKGDAITTTNDLGRAIISWQNQHK